MAKPSFTPNTGRHCKGNTCVWLVKVLLWSLFLLHCPTFLVASLRECPEGTYMSLYSIGDQYKCSPCPDGTFMPVSHSKHRQCYDCTQIENATLEVLIRPCEKTRDADIQCVQGFYRVLPRNPRQKAVCKECTPCHELFHEIRACQNYSNTYCCADVNYDFILDKSGTAWCRERNWMCRRGQYLDTSLNKCNPCPDNTFMAQDYHSYTSCWPCHSTLDADVPLHTEIIQQCNSTHPALYRCKEGYYVNHTLSYRETDIGCSPCQTCQQGTFVGRPCNTFQNTVCCPQENMTVVDGDEGVTCQDMPEVEEFLKFTTPSLGVSQNMTSQSQVTDSSYLQTKRETSIWLYVFTFIGVSATVGLLGLCLILFWRRCLVLFLIKGYWFRRKDDNVPDGFDLKNTKNRRGSLTAEHILLDKINDSSIFKSSGYGRNELMDEAVSITERIQNSQGNQMTDVSRERDVVKVICRKNPGHQNFIPVKYFDIKHLPPRYHDKLLVEWVRATSQLICCLLVTGFDGGRPETWPDREQVFLFSNHKGKNSRMRGTGWLSSVNMYTEMDNINCACKECFAHIPKKTWGVIRISTACQIVYNSEEAKHTKCQFFNDSHETYINKVLTLEGLEVVNRDIKGDWCMMEYVTHDMELLDNFYKMHRRWEDLRDKVFNKYVSNKSPGLCVPGVGSDTNIDHDLCIIVSHPHGRGKTVSVGTLTQRHVVNNNGLRENFTYSYNTPTCPGSAGAPVLTLNDADRTSGRLSLCDPPPHSLGRPGNDNSSGVGQKWIVSSLE